MAPQDERVRRSKEKVLAAASEMLGEVGVGAFSIDALARRSGVAKMTIYRHWPSRAALILDACSRMTDRPEAPDTGSLRGDLTALAKAMAQRMQSGRWSSLLPSIIDAAERDPELAALHAAQNRAVTAAVRSVIERAKARHELRSDQDTGELVALLLGPLVYRRWFSRERISPAFVDQVVETALSTIGAGAPQAAAGRARRG